MIKRGFTFPVWQQPHVSNRTDYKGRDQRTIATEIVESFKDNPMFPYWTDETFTVSSCRLIGNRNTIWHCLSDKSRYCYPTGYTRMLPKAVVPFDAFEHSLAWWLEYLGHILSLVITRT